MWCRSVVWQGANLPDGYAQMPSAISYLCTGKAEEGEQTIHLASNFFFFYSILFSRHLRFVFIINHGRLHIQLLVQRHRFQTNDHLLLCRRSNAQRSTQKKQHSQDFQLLRPRIRSGSNDTQRNGAFGGVCSIGEHLLAARAFVGRKFGPLHNSVQQFQGKRRFLVLLLSPSFESLPTGDEHPCQR